MRALTWHGKHDVRVDTVDDPEILNPRDAIIKITSTAICGSDLHLYDGYIPTMKAGDILGTKAFVDNFTEALRNELKDADGITLTTLMPGPVDTEFFARGEMLDTQVGADPNKSDPVDVAKTGWEALMGGKASVFAGWKAKVQGMMANVTPGSVLAEQHRKMAEPGSADR
jgi:short-subunit dehydrogenase